MTRPELFKAPLAVDSTSSAGGVVGGESSGSDVEADSADEGADSSASPAGSGVRGRSGILLFVMLAAHQYCTAKCICISLFGLV